MYTVFRTKTYVFAGNRSRISTAKGHAIAIVSTKQAHCTNMQHWPRRPQEELKKLLKCAHLGKQVRERILCSKEVTTYFSSKYIDNVSLHKQQ